MSNNDIRTFTRLCVLKSASDDGYFFKYKSNVDYYLDRLINLYLTHEPKFCDKQRIMREYQEMSNRLKGTNIEVNPLNMLSLLIAECDEYMTFSKGRRLEAWTEFHTYLNNQVPKNHLKFIDVWEQGNLIQERL